MRCRPIMKMIRWGHDKTSEGLFDTPWALVSGCRLHEPALPRRYRGFRYFRTAANIAILSFRRPRGSRLHNRPVTPGPAGFRGQGGARRPGQRR